MVTLLLTAWLLGGLGLTLVIGAAVRLADARDPSAWSGRPITTADLPWGEPLAVVVPERDSTVTPPLH